MSRLESVKIQPIDKTTASQICSAQVVLDLATAVKELIENSIDAGANVIQIKFEEFGKDSIEVADNGCGVEEINFQALTLKHHTSKITSFSDINSLETFGFRGEALNSLCFLSEMTITTQHRNATIGHALKFDHNGVITSKTKTTRQVGTTVRLENIFSTLPIRRTEFLTNLTKEFRKACEMVYAYGLLPTGVRIIVTNVASNSKSSNKGNRENLEKKSKNSSLIMDSKGQSFELNIAAIFGSEIKKNLIRLTETLPSEETLSEYRLESKNLDLNKFKLDGYISSCAHGSGVSFSNRQFYYINSRPTDNAQVSKLVNAIYHQFNKRQYPFVVLNIKTEREIIDLNVTPDKRLILIQNEILLLAVLKESLLAVFKDIPATLEVRSIDWWVDQRKSNKDKKSQIDSKDTNDSESSVPLKKETTSTQRPKSQILPESKKTPQISTTINFLQTFARQSTTPSTSSYIQESTANTNANKNNDFKKPSISFVEQTTAHQNLQPQIVSESIKLSQTSTETNFLQTFARSSSTFYAQKSANKNITNNFSSTVPFFKESTTGTQNVESHVIIEASENTQASAKVNFLQTFARSPTSTKITNRNNTATHELMPEISNERLTKSQFISNISASEADINGRLYDTVKVKEKENFNPAEIKGTIVNDLDIAEKSKEDDSEGSEVDEGLTDEIKNSRKTILLDVSICDIKTILEQGKKSCERDEDNSHIEFVSQKNLIDDHQSDNELKIELTKENFRQMEVIGQFNKGFIITRLGSDLFVIDQHASDEKYNFENLQKSTKITNQSLIVPVQLELTIDREELMVENRDIFIENGFDFIFNERGERTKRISLTSVPSCMGKLLEKDDVYELLFLIESAPELKTFRPAKLRNIFASKACRKSVMIGTSLDHSQMKQIVTNMAEMEQPWNCPHGRPTIKHLLDLNKLKAK